jgi:hypothetical protein
MTAFLRINGLEISSLIDGFEINDESVENYSRSASDSLEGLTFSVKKDIKFSTSFMTAADAYSLENWVRGRRHYWSFERQDGSTTRFTLSSADAALSFSRGSLFTPSLRWTYALQLLSNASSNATATFGSEGDWSVHFYHRLKTTAPYVSYGAVSRNGTITAWEGTASATTIRMASISVASGYLGLSLRGLDSAGAQASVLFDCVSIMPYALTTTMFLALASAYWGGSTLGQPRPPFIEVYGDCLQTNSKTFNGAGEKGPFYAKGLVEDTEVQPVVLNGAVNGSARRMSFRLVEK